jgi:hypothetical protein
MLAAITYRSLAGEIPFYDNKESVLYGQQKGGHEYIFQKSKNHFKILDTRRVT